MHWNILADKLADSFDKVPKDFLKWEYRFDLIKKHIKQVNPDVVGLSEVDVLPLYREIAEFMMS
jgi:mRNA deadenylase 3'-5' endonuclease subunit Ccr4